MPRKRDAPSQKRSADARRPRWAALAIGAAVAAVAAVAAGRRARAAPTASLAASLATSRAGWAADRNPSELVARIEAARSCWV